MRGGTSYNGVRSQATSTVAEEASNFIKNIINEDLETGATGGRIATRFPPEPNGYLHIGHAKSICLNFGLAQEYKGTCNLRFDDTNPLTEDVEYVNSIINDVKWLGFEPTSILYTSDYFERLYELAVKLIEQGDAFVDTSTEEEIREMRGSVKTPGTESKCRAQSVKENLELFEKMRNGEFEDGEAVLRAKIDMASPNMLLRDPVIYRIKKSPPHHRTEKKWCIYPMYDFAHPLSDAIEDITHSICTLEFDVHRPLYDWLVDKLFDGPRPHQYEMGRLNLDYTLTSKRKLLKLVEQGKVSGWDDPRMPTIAGIRRKGIPPGAIRRFCKMVGVSRSESRVEMDMLEAAIREELNTITPRTMAVLDPLKVTITNWPEDKVETLSAPLFPDTLEKTEIGSPNRDIPFTRELYIEKADFMLNPPKKYFRLKPGGEVRLRYGYIIKCDEVITDPDTNGVIELKCTYDPETKSGTGTSTKKVKGTIHWVSATEGKPVKVNLYEPMLKVPNPDETLAQDENLDIMDLLNPTSLRKTQGFVEPYVHESLEKDEENDVSRFQFERQGFFAHDKMASSLEGDVILNRIVGLRDTWAKMLGNQAGRQQRGSGRRERDEAKHSDAEKEISLNDAVVLQVGEILEAWPHPDADKLICLKVNVGDEDGPRTIVSGIREHYQEGDLSGKQVVVVSNLKPSKIRGMESKGMILAASDKESAKLELLRPPQGAKAGDRVSTAEGGNLPSPDLKSPSNKMWKKLAAKLSVDAEGVARFGSYKIQIPDLGDCKVDTIKNNVLG
eukprot:CAMPEP_0184495716 /NCGR_PEP_ID=MMETSP0113_2-20130426/32135_1 /TAXON_ID=91329 /ORGANISM="Norrisiella sphaerica, Strain BC52" /LENGTH=783 /DNA_ID=CAMNT_0026882029 /DNA_START=246 /DNA_END=2597 /DNA_ORIENTATION=+